MSEENTNMFIIGSQIKDETRSHGIEFSVFPYVHPSIESVSQEAARLAEKHPNKRFYIFRCVAMITAKAIELEIKEL